MAKQLLLLRHGRIVASHVGLLIGATDVPVDPAALMQLQTVGKRLLPRKPEVCYCSPLARCRQTALAVAPHLPIHVDADLREIDFGRWEQHTFAEAAADDPSLIDRWAAFDAGFAFPGGESVGSFLHRVRAAAERLIAAQADTVLLVTHGGVIRAMLCHLLGLDPRHYAAFQVGYAAVAVVELVDGKGVLAALEQAELPEGDDG
jgi:alpha-ribazole phosphatase